MAIDRDRQVEQRLQQPMQMRGGGEILAAYDVGDALESIVEDRGEMIARS